MTRSYPPNGGSSEYSNIINGVGNVKRLLDEEFAKKLAEGDLLALVGLVTAGSSATLQALTANNIVPFQRSNISQLVNSAASIADDVAASTGNIVRGGIGGLVAAGKTLFAIAGKIIAIVLAILMAVFFIETEIQRISGIINELLSLRDRVAALEEELTGLRQVTEQGFQAVNNNVVAVNSNLENVQSNLARGIRITASSTNELIKAESFGVKTAVNSVKTQPSRMQSELCSYLDGAFGPSSEKSDIAATLSKGCFSGTFVYTSSEMIAQLLNGNAAMVEQYFFKNIKPVNSTVLPESVSDAPEGGGKKGGFGGGQSEQQRLEQRLGFLHKALHPYAPKPDDFTPTVVCFASVLVGMALAEPGSFERTTYEELHWLLPLLLDSRRQ